jgi:hypothetical protein
VRGRRRAPGRGRCVTPVNRSQPGANTLGGGVPSSARRKLR